MTDHIYNSAVYFSVPLIDPYGFREYDARWIIEPVAGESSDQIQLNYQGLFQIGNYLGRFLSSPEHGGHSEVLVGHDFRSYSQHCKHALILGLVSSGINVCDIGLGTTPVAYFAQYAYEIPAVAMVTASHNANGWTGIKMGDNYSRTFTPTEMTQFKEFIANESPFVFAENGGRYRFKVDAVERYIKDLCDSWLPRFEGLPRLRVAVETGNGTAGIVLPQVLTALGFEVIPGHIEPDWTFPNFNPNPESIPFLKSVERLVVSSGADIGVCLDGDGDRLGVVDDKGSLVFSDRMSLIVAKRLEELMGPGKFVVDVKATSLFNRLLDSEISWVPTGHSFVKSALATEKANAGFERSGHIFFAPPYGRGYDDACLAAVVLLWILCEQKVVGRSFSDLLSDLPPSHQSPNCQPAVPEATKYEIARVIEKRIQDEIARSGEFAGRKVERVVLINGIRCEFNDGAWFLIRASSNTPNLVIVAETFGENDEDLRSLDTAIRSLVSDMEDVGPFDPLYET